MKSYNQYCGVALALDLIGDRWSLLIVRELLLGPRRYGQILDALPGITTNLLASRLKTLNAEGILSKEPDGYHLSDHGLGLAPAILALGKFGFGLMKGPPKDGMATSARWLAINLQWRYLGGWSGAFQIQIGKNTLVVANQGDKLAVQDANLDNALPCLTTQNAGIRRWILGGEQAADLLAMGDLMVTRSPDVVVALDRCLKRLEPHG